MITLDYAIREAPPPDRDLAAVDQGTIHYNLFVGDVVFRIGQADMSASWGWIPIIDFAVGLHRIASEIESSGEQSFEFTESESRIDFVLRDQSIEIRSTYAAAEATVSMEEFRSATGAFLRRVLDDLTKRYPGLAHNPYIRQIYPSSSSA